MINIFSKIFGTSNDREVKKYAKKIQLINALESKYQDMSDETLQNTFNTLKDEVLNEQRNNFV